MGKESLDLLEGDMLLRKRTDYFVNLALKNSPKGFMKEKKKRKWDQEI